MEDQHTLITVKEDQDTQEHSCMNSWIDKIKNNEPFNNNHHHWLKWIILCYFGFSLLLASFHLGLKMMPTQDIIKLTRTYDPDATYSALDNMSFDLKMSKILSKSDIKSVHEIVPYWKKAKTPITDEQDITLVTVVYNDTWNQFIDLVESWKGPVSAVLYTTSHLSNISSDYHQRPDLYKHVTLHLAPLHVPENASRNLARLYSRTHHILDATTNIVLSLDLRTRLLENKMQYADMMARGDMLVVPTFKTDSDIRALQRQEMLQLIDNKTVGLYDPHFDLNQGPTRLPMWRDSHDPYYRVDSYAMQYEPIVIQSKSVQPWCSERFMNQRSTCFLSAYLAGNEFKVLTHEWAIYKKAKPTSELNNVIEKRIHIYFLMEQCIHYGRQLDALGLWKKSQAFHVKAVCSEFLSKWGKNMIKHY